MNRQIEKFQSLDEMKKITKELRKKNKKIVFANGCFDIIHIGHIRYLKEAKNFGDILIVAVNDDSSIKRIKGEDRPFYPVLERVEILNELKCIDYIVVFSENTVENILLTLRPDFHAKGGDYTVDTVPEAEIVKGIGGKVIITGGDKVRSSSELIYKMVENEK